VGYGYSRKNIRCGYIVPDGDRCCKALDRWIRIENVFYVNSSDNTSIDKTIQEKKADDSVSLS
jgi:hypothetical protein